MYIKELEFQDLVDVAKLESEMYPSELCLGVSDFEEDYESSKFMYKFWYGAYKRGELVGYVIAHTTNTFGYSKYEVYVSDLVCKDKLALMPLLIKLFARIKGSKVMCELRSTSRKILQNVMKRYPELITTYKEEYLPNYYCEGEHAWKVEIELMDMYDTCALSKYKDLCLIYELYASEHKGLKTFIENLYHRYKFTYEEIEHYKKLIINHLYNRYVDYYSLMGDTVQYLVTNEVKAYNNKYTKNVTSFKDTFVKNNEEYTEGNSYYSFMKSAEFYISCMDKKWYRPMMSCFRWYRFKEFDHSMYKDYTLAYYRRFINKKIVGFEKKQSKFVSTIEILNKNGGLFMRIDNANRCNNLVPYINSLSFKLILNSFRYKNELKEKFNNKFNGGYNYFELDTMLNIKKHIGTQKFEEYFERLMDRIENRYNMLLKDETNTTTESMKMTSACHDMLYPTYEIFKHRKYLTATALYKSLDRDYESLLAIKDILNILGTTEVRRMNVGKLRKEISAAIRKGENIKALFNDIQARVEKNFMRRNKITKALCEAMSGFMSKINRYAPRASMTQMFSYFGEHTSDIVYQKYEGLFKEQTFEYTPFEIGQLVKKCLGNRGKGALVNNPQGLFKSLAKIQPVNEIVAGNIAKENIPMVMQEIKQRNVEFPKIYPTLGELSAKIEHKCSPEFLTAGDASVCCMSFGQHKAIQYALEKGFGIFNIYYKGRVVANSLIWINDLYNCLVLDNIEVAPNYVHLNDYIKNLYHEMIDYVIREYKVDFAVQGYTYNDLKLYEDNVERCNIYTTISEVKDIPDNYISDFRKVPRDVDVEYFYSDASRCYVVGTNEFVNIEIIKAIVSAKNDEHNAQLKLKNKENEGAVRRTVQPIEPAARAIPDFLF